MTTRSLVLPTFEIFAVKEYFPLEVTVVFAIVDHFLPVHRCREAFTPFAVAVPFTVNFFFTRTVLGAFFTFTVAFLGCGTGTEAETFDAVGPATVAAGGAASAWAAGTPIAPKNIVAEQARLTIVLRNMSPLLVLRGRSDPATPHRDCRESEKELKHSQLQCKFLRFLTRRIQVPAGEPDPARSAGSVVVTNEPRAATLDV